MLYRIIFIFLFFQGILSGQSLFNRWIGSNPFMGSSRSTAMGNTHLLNSTGSKNVRFNPANLGMIKSKLGFDLQVNRLSVFERWSMPVRDSFGEFLTNADYVANEFSCYGINSGLFASLNLPMIGVIGAGFHYAPLTHFTYHYSEEIRGSHSIEDGEYSSKDPIVGYQILDTEGTPMVSSLGGGIKLDVLRNIHLSIGGTINLIQSTTISDRVEVDTLYSDVTNLSTLPDINATAEFLRKNFMTFSTIINLASNIQLGVSWEEGVKAITTPYSWSIDSTNGLFQYFDDNNYMVSGVNYMKPEINSFAFSYISELGQMISINFEVNRISYKGHLYLNDYNQYKFGFEYFTQMGTPIRGGLVYRTAYISAMKPVSMFTFGSGKSIGNLMVDVAGTYCFQSFSYPDLFPVEGDIRTDYDLVRDSQLHLQLALTYQF